MYLRLGNKREQSKIVSLWRLVECDLAEGFCPDGSPDIAAFTVPSPGGANVLSQGTSIYLNSVTLQIIVTSTPGWIYLTESSTDLDTWIPWSAPVTASGPTVTFPAATGSLRWLCCVRPVP